MKSTNVGAVLVAVCGLIASAASSCSNFVPTIEPFTCCALPKLLDVVTVGECMNQYAGAPTSQPQAKGSSPTDCMSECIANRTAIYNKRMQLDEKQLTNTFTESLPDKSPWLGIVRKSIGECLKKAEGKKTDFTKAMATQAKTTRNDPVCSPLSGFLITCIHTTVFGDCPANLRTSSTECDDIWKYLQRCPFDTIGA